MYKQNSMPCNNLYPQKPDFNTKLNIRTKLDVHTFSLCGPGKHCDNGGVDRESFWWKAFMVSKAH